MHHCTQEYPQNLQDSKFLLKLTANLLGYLTFLFMQKPTQPQQQGPAFYSLIIIFNNSNFTCSLEQVWALPS